MNTPIENKELNENQQNNQLEEKLEQYEKEIQKLRQENKELRSKIDKMTLQIGKINSELSTSKQTNEDMFYRIQVLEQGYVNKKEYDFMMSQITNSLEMMRQTQTTLFKMMEMTSQTIGNEDLQKSVIDCCGLFDSLTNSFLPNEYNQYQDNNCDNLLESEDSFGHAMEFVSKGNPLHNRLNQTTINNANAKPILTDSVIVEDLNKN